ncbi:MAG: hypothetical protein COB36_09370 [Alphaproteobacteria bacterium]|nr:MAG: hypothetical protein COB36_09370 [Alphaproteobacteria bacterium]
MNSPQHITKRNFLRSAGGFALLLSVSGGMISMGTSAHADDGDSLSAHVSQTLRVMVRRLFPHEGVGDGPYNLVIPGLSNVPGVTDLGTLLKEGVKALDDESRDTEWRMLPEAEQISALKMMEKSRFFQVMMMGTITSLYRNPEVWKHLGYEGSSVEYGGYIERGFDDIDWLPEG